MQKILTFQKVLLAILDTARTETPRATVFTAARENYEIMCGIALIVNEQRRCPCVHRGEETPASCNYCWFLAQLNLLFKQGLTTKKLSEEF
jgi:hypothetical protein